MRALANTTGHVGPPDYCSTRALLRVQSTRAAQCLPHAGGVARSLEWLTAENTSTLPAPGRRVGVQAGWVVKTVRRRAPAEHVVVKVRQRPISTIQPLTAGEAEVQRRGAQHIPGRKRQCSEQRDGGHFVLRFPYKLAVWGQGVVSE